MSHTFYGKGIVDRMIPLQRNANAKIQSILEEEIANEIERHHFMRQMMFGEVHPLSQEPLTAEMIERAASIAESRIKATYTVDPIVMPVVISPGVPKDTIMFVDGELQVKTEADRDNLIEKIGRGDFSSIITVMKVKVDGYGLKQNDNGRVRDAAPLDFLRDPGTKRP